MSTETTPNRLANLPAWVRWIVAPALGVLVIALVQTFGTDDTSLLTNVSTSQAMIRWAVPILLAGLGGLFAERAGVVNIGLEGMMILGTWFGAWGAFNWGPWVGLLAGIIGGALGGLIHAVATVNFGVDHIISGVAINIVAPAGARYLSSEIFTGYEGGSISQSPRVASVGSFTFPFLAGGKIGSWRSPDMLGWVDKRDWFWVSDVAGLLKGTVSKLSWMTVLALVAVPVSAYVLKRTRFGLRLRIAGERPAAGESLGVDIYRHKYYGVLASGAFAGMAGAFIVIELTGIYREGQTTGRGFIGIAAVIFGNWSPWGVLAGSMVFGYPFGLQLRDLDGAASHALLLVMTVALLAVAAWAFRQGRRINASIAAILGVGMAFWYVVTDTVPNWFPGVTPFLIVLLVLVFASQRLRTPASLGLPYQRGGD